ncbi:hypothetical protein [Truepera radiovictrix]|nr:hypothetical protein [Truepera radiovictrix]WMT58151.1 hypothetical protein RCV51_04175 [Truepera radiovictrix]
MGRLGKTNMNYAALLALLAALAFVSPFLVNLATQVGVPRGFGIVTTLTVGVFIVAWAVVRQRVERHQRLEARIALLQARRRTAPHDPRGYFSEGEHLGDLLTEAGRPREALRVFEAYARLLQTLPEREGERAVTEAVIAKLRRELAEREEEHGASV